MMEKPKQPSLGSAEAGAAIYSKILLSLYDLGVIKLSNRFTWRCPSPLMLDFYDQNISANHLDVGVGTGYFLDQCRYPAAAPRIALLDLNPNSLAMTAERLRRYHPITYLANVLEPLQLNTQKFDSIGLNYLLHCLPGTMPSKHRVFENLIPWLNPGGVIFGTTILGRDISPNFVARRLMKLYNVKGIFSNSEDRLSGLEAILGRHFRDYQTKTVGCVAFFTGRIKSENDA
jgi:ubiquinone/menaquinone biosynthesis C-methylase UbiE